MIKENYRQLIKKKRYYWKLYITDHLYPQVIMIEYEQVFKNSIPNEDLFNNKQVKELNQRFLKVSHTRFKSNYKQDDIRILKQLEENLKNSVR